MYFDSSNGLATSKRGERYMKFFGFQPAGLLTTAAQTFKYDR